jgi:N-acetylmuramoyl-L-alanine amidase
MRVCLDPGHGYKQGLPNGARGNGVIEDLWCFAFAERLAHYLRKRGHETVLTKTTANFVTLKERVKLAKRQKCDVFISVHNNAAGSAQANGCEAFVVKGDGASEDVARQLVQVMTDAGLRSRGVKPDTLSAVKSLYVLRNTYAVMPAVLIEVGFLSNAADAAKLRDRRWSEDLACNMAAALDG